MFCGGAVWIFHCRAKMPVRHLRLDGEEQDPLQFQLHFEPKPQPHFPMVSIEIFDDEDFINVLSCCLGLSLKRVAQFLPPNYRPSLQPSNTSTSPQKLNGVSGNFSLRAWICISVLSICIGDKRNRTKKKEGWTGKEKKKNYKIIFFKIIIIFVLIYKFVLKIQILVSNKWKSRTIYLVIERVYVV